MHTPIELKLGAQKGLIKAHLCTNFGWNPIRIYGVMIDFLCEKGHAYRINHCKELDETCYVDGVTIVGVLFLWFKMSWGKDHRDMT